MSQSNLPSEPTAALLGLEPVKHERYAERVYDSLFHSIMSGKMQAQTRLPSEQQLAAFFQVSRPVVRQALDRLRQDRLIDSRRGSGTFVRALESHTRPAIKEKAPDMGHWMHGIELRLALEPECAALAALRRSTDDLAQMRTMLNGFEQAVASGSVAHHFDFGFHEAIARASANPRMLDAIRLLEYDVSHAVNLWRHMAQLKPWRRSQDVIDEHRAIYRHIEEQDPEAARRAMRSHVEKARVRMLHESGMD
jgi:GntR family transcriptional repressor for pyruvate dehydrogenase complex